MADMSKLTALEQLDALAAATSAEITKVKEALPKKVSDLSNDSGYQTADEVNSAISSQVGRVYKPSGTVEFAGLPEPSVDVLGNVYNISNKFTTDERFVDGAGNKIPAGTNVAVVQVGDDYKFDVLAGTVDLSGYVEKESGKGLSANDYTTDEKTKLNGIASGATKVEASSIAGNVKINGVETTVVQIATDEEVAAVIGKYFPQST